MTDWDKAKAQARLMNKEALLVKVLTLFLQQLPERMSDIRLALNEQAWQTLRHHAHTLKGSAGEIVATRLQVSLQHLEQAAIEKSGINAAHAFSEAEQAAISLRPVLESYLDTY